MNSNIFYDFKVNLSLFRDPIFVFLYIDLKWFYYHSTIFAILENVFKRNIVSNVDCLLNVYNLKFKLETYTNMFLKASNLENCLEGVLLYHRENDFVPLLMRKRCTQHICYKSNLNLSLNIYESTKSFLHSKATRMVYLCSEISQQK